MTKVEIIEQILLIEPQFNSCKGKLWAAKKRKLEIILDKLKKEKGVYYDN